MRGTAPEAPTLGSMWLGVDDTDSPRGGCTTWVLTELVRVAQAHGLDLVGEPRLVRLNPNVPWKTRGNAALSMRVGHGRGAHRKLGEIDGRPVLAYARGVPPDGPTRARFVDAAWAAVLDAAPEEPGTDPALVVGSRRPGPELYWQAVREVVRVGPVERSLARLGAEVRVRGSRRGLIGAAASIAWPARRATWELLAYRRPARIGTPREVEAASIRAARRLEPDLFLCEDPRTRRLLVTPHTDCPILFGLRGRRPAAPLAARRRIVSEPVDRWLLFRTNQGTGDHLVERPASELQPYRSAIVLGAVATAPEIGRGGHVRFSLSDPEGDLVPCVAFEPTKTLPLVASALVEGDQLRVWGSWGPPGSLRLEGIRLVRRVPRGAWGPPDCPRCGRRTGSLGRARGFRCDGCRARFPPEAAVWSPRPSGVRPGTYHPTPSARRHLAPLGPEP